VQVHHERHDPGTEGAAGGQTLGHQCAEGATAARACATVAMHAGHAERSLQEAPLGEAEGVAGGGQIGGTDELSGVLGGSPRLTSNTEIRSVSVATCSAKRAKAPACASISVISSSLESCCSASRSIHLWIQAIRRASISAERGRLTTRSARG